MFRKVLGGAAIAIASLAILPATAGAAHDAEFGSHSCFSVVGISHPFSASPAEIQGHRFRDLEDVNLFNAQLSFVLEQSDSDECAEATPPEIGMAYYLHLDNNPARPHPDSVLAQSVTTPTNSGLFWYWTLYPSQIEGDPCGSQLDVFFGEVLEDFRNGNMYANRLIGAANYTNDTAFCDPVTPTTEVPPSTSTPPTTETTSTVTPTVSVTSTSTTATVESTTSTTAGSAGKAPNCEQLGLTNIPLSDPNYRADLDSDADGVACEVLAFTGGNTGLTIFVGSALVGLGASLLAVRRFRLNG